ADCAFSGRDRDGARRRLAERRPGDHLRAAGSHLSRQRVFDAQRARRRGGGAPAGGGYGLGLYRIFADGTRRALGAGRQPPARRRAVRAAHGARDARLRPRRAGGVRGAGAAGLTANLFVTTIKYAAEGALCTNGTNTNAPPICGTMVSISVTRGISIGKQLLSQ